MNRTQTINAQIFQCLSYIADDSNYMKKALRALKRLTKQKMASQVESAYTKSEQEVLNDIPNVVKQITAARNGEIKGTSLGDFLNEL